MNSVNNFQKIFQQHKAYIAYLTAGQRGLEYTEKAAISLIEAGVDILEIGVPFSDPIADGPIIQNASEDALKRGTQLSDILGIIKKIKNKYDTPIILFTYSNPIYQHSETEIFEKAKTAGVDGILLVDLPLENCNNYFMQSHDARLEPILLISPNTSSARIRRINQHCNSFLYYACRKGITGIKSELPFDYQNKMSEIKNNSNSPIVTGFGISSRKTAAAALKYADGFVVGSLFVKAIKEGTSFKDLKKLAIAIDPR